MVTTEILSGETTSRRAKRVLYPLLLIYTFNFFSSVVRWQISGYSGFTTGTPERAGYSVIEHGRTIHVTAWQYWLGHFQLLILIVGLVAWFVARAYFFLGCVTRGIGCRAWGIRVGGWVNHSHYSDSINDQPTPAPPAHRARCLASHRGCACVFGRPCSQRVAGAIVSG
jgi:hypothetical protein